MSRYISIKKNMIMNIILTCTNFIFPLITYSYVSRVLQPAGMGRIAFVSSVLSYFSWIAILGIPAYGIRLCAKYRDNKSELSTCVQELFIINLISTVVAYSTLIFTVILVPRFRQDAVLFEVMSISLLLNTIGLEWLYQALEQYSYITIRSISFKIVSVILVILLIKSPNDYVIYGALTVFASSASYILNYMNVKKYISLRPITTLNYRRHLKPIFTLFAASVAISIYASFDMVILGFIKTDTDVGLFSTAVKIKSIVLSVSTACTAVLVPRMANYIQNGQVEIFRQLALKSLRVSCILAVPLTAFVFMNASDVILFISGYEYLSAAPTLKILMISVFALIFSSLFGTQILIPKGDEKRYSQSVFIGMFINLTLNLALIPRYGAMGAAIGTLVTEYFNVFWMSGGAKEERSYLFTNLNSHKYLISLMVSAASGLFMKELANSLNVFLRLTFMTITMFGTYYAILILFKEPIIVQQIQSIQESLKQRKLNTKRLK